jgi:hypothetical protein
MKPTVYFISAAIAAILCLLLIQGCSGSAEEMAGTYALDRESAKASAQAKADAESNAARKKALQATANSIDDVSFQITLNGDGSASMTSGTLEARKASTGTWTNAGNTITLTMTPSDGGAAETITATIEGDTMKLTPPADSVLPFEIVLKKRAMN